MTQTKLTSPSLTHPSTFLLDIILEQIDERVYKNHVVVGSHSIDDILRNKYARIDTKNQHGHRMDLFAHPSIDLPI
jgi:hypothetical protein